MEMINIALFLSGTGSSVINLLRYFKDHQYIRIALVVSNNPNFKIPKEFPVDLVYFTKDSDLENVVLKSIQSHHIQWLVLAGFLRKIPKTYVSLWPNHITNIHPALLPKYGGKGMYGLRVHEAVLKAGETHTGFTIHMVNEAYDEGSIIFQHEIPVSSEDTPHTLQEKVKIQEQHFYPQVLEKLVLAKGRA